MINYRANAWAMKEVGVERILGPCAAGSLKKEVEPGTFVVSDQLVDRTWGRTTPSTTGPRRRTCRSPIPTVRRFDLWRSRSGASLGSPIHERGTVVTIQGPRFSTRAESKWFQDAGWEVINMTQYPEAYLARELEICYTNVALITDYDVGLTEDVDAVSHEAGPEGLQREQRQAPQPALHADPEDPRGSELHLLDRPPRRELVQATQSISRPRLRPGPLRPTRLVSVGLLRS